MAEPEILFDVDASKILAKLHLGALEACKNWRADGFFVNTGIKNDNPSATPDNPGKVEFDLTNEQYEVGYVTELKQNQNNAATSVAEQISPLLNKINIEIPSAKENNKILKDINEIITKNLTYLGKLGLNQKKLLDTFKTSPEFVAWVQKKNASKKDSVASKRANVAANVAKEIKDDRKKGLLDKDIRKNAIGDIDKSINAKTASIDPDKFQTRDLIKVPELFKLYMQQLVNKLQSIAKTTGSSSFSLMTIDDVSASKAFSGLQAYMQVFVGDKAKNLKEELVVRQFAPSSAKDSNDKSLVANFEIVPADEKEVELQQKQNEANKDKATMKVCFKIGYSVVVDK